MTVFYYRAYNLLIQSEVECLELPSVEADSGLVPDVNIHFGESPTFLPDSLARYNNCFIVPNQCLLVLDGGPRIWVRNGNEMVVTCPTQHLDADARLWLLDMCFGVLLH